MTHTSISVIPVKKERLAEYRKMARASAKIFLKHGALNYVEAIEEDVKPGKTTSFPQSLKLKPNEVIVVAIATFKSLKQHNAAWKKMMKEPFFASMDMKNAPFDMKRMYFGGFKSITKS